METVTFIAISVYKLFVVILAFSKKKYNNFFENCWGVVQVVGQCETDVAPITIASSESF